MICTKCRDEGKTSKVYSEGGTSTLLGGGGPYWDEEGVYHNHDPNTRTIGFHCSNGHTWVTKSKPSCPAGDYGGEKEVEYYDKAARQRSLRRSPQ